MEYHFDMHRLISARDASFVVFVLLAFFFFVPALSAQINGVPASVTSIGFGGHHDRMPGVPASVTSLGPNGFQGSGRPASGVHFFTDPSCCGNRLFPSKPDHSFGRHHRSQFFPGAVPVYALPYTPVIIEQPMEEPAAAEEDEYRGGPTIFDRRGPGTRRPEEDYAERSRREQNLAELESPRAAEPEPVPEPDQPQTLLVFNDGHQLEVRNYAIVGETLFDLSPGHRRKIALAELNLKETVKENDDRGIDFRLPPNVTVD